MKATHMITEVLQPLWQHFDGFKDTMSHYHTLPRGVSKGFSTTKRLQLLTWSLFDIQTFDILVTHHLKQMILFSCIIRKSLVSCHCIMMPMPFTSLLITLSWRHFIVTGERLSTGPDDIFEKEHIYVMFLRICFYDCSILLLLLLIIYCT